MLPKIQEFDLALLYKRSFWCVVRSNFGNELRLFFLFATFDKAGLFA